MTWARRNMIQYKVIIHLGGMTSNHTSNGRKQVSRFEEVLHPFKNVMVHCIARI